MNLLPQSQHKTSLAEFWAHFGGCKCSGIGLPQSKKLRLLQEYAALRITYKAQRPLLERRTKFDAIKSDRHQLKSHSCCFVCLKPAKVRHHIIQLQFGGINSKRNMVSLCHACHAAIHPWLSR